MILYHFPEGKAGDPEGFLLESLELVEWAGQLMAALITLGQNALQALAA